MRENGGQYTHAAIWTAIAHVLMGDRDGAYRMFQMLSPINHARTPEEAAHYKVEPYVIAADVYSHPQHMGRGGWTWYTGSASWFYRLGVEYILGFRLHGDHFTIEPCIPSHWPGYSLTYRHKDTWYHISVENTPGVEQSVSPGPSEEEGGEAQSGCEVEIVELDGSPLSDRKVPLVDDGKRHEVRVVLRPPKDGSRQDHGSYSK